MEYTPKQQRHVADALFDLLQASRDFAVPGECVFAAYTLCTEGLRDGGTTEEIETAKKLALRLYKMACGLDDGRFTLWDYADAVCNYPMDLSFQELLDLSDDAFSNLMLYVAKEKRKTYSTDPMPIDEDEASRIIQFADGVLTITWDNVWSTGKSSIKVPCRIRRTDKRVSAEIDPAGLPPEIAFPTTDGSVGIKDLLDAAEKAGNHGLDGMSVESRGGRHTVRPSGKEDSDGYWYE